MHEIRLGAIEAIPVVPFIDRFAGLHVPDVRLAVDHGAHLVAFGTPDSQLHLMVCIIYCGIEYKRVAGVRVCSDIPIPQVAVD